MSIHTICFVIQVMDIKPNFRITWAGPLGLAQDSSYPDVLANRKHSFIPQPTQIDFRPAFSNQPR